MKFYETPRFKELEEFWKKRLQDSGFQDIEKGQALKQRASNAYRHAAIVVIEARQTYFDLLTKQVREEKFQCDLYRTIMEMWASGKTRMQILEAIKGGASQGREDRFYETIRFIIRRFEYKWNIKTYTAKQMKLKKLPTR